MNEDKKEAGKEAELTTLIGIISKKFPHYDDFFHPETSKKLFFSSFGLGGSAMGLALITAVVSPAFTIPPFLFTLCAKGFVTGSLLFVGSPLAFIPSAKASEYLNFKNKKLPELDLTPDETRKISNLLESRVPDPSILKVGEVLEILENMLVEHRQHLASVKSFLGQNSIFSKPSYKAPEQVVNLILGYHDSPPEEKNIPVMHS